MRRDWARGAWLPRNATLPYSLEFLPLPTWSHWENAGWTLVTASVTTGRGTCSFRSKRRSGLGAA